MPEKYRSQLLIDARLLQHENQRHLWTKMSRWRDEGVEGSGGTSVGTFSRTDLAAAKDWFIYRFQIQSKGFESFG